MDTLANTDPGVGCSICTRTFTRPADLRRHMKTHDPDKENLKHACPYEGCTYKTLQPSNLKTHLNIHTGAKPYECTEAGCDYKYSDPAALTRHRKRGKHGSQSTDDVANEEGGSQATITRRDRRRWRRAAPYPSVSQAAPGGSGASSASAPDAPLQGFIPATPAVPGLLDFAPPNSQTPRTSMDGRNARNAFVGHSSELITGIPQAVDRLAAPMQAPQLGPMTREEPSMEWGPNSFSLEQTFQGTLPTFDLPNGLLLPSMDLNWPSNGFFADLLPPSANPLQEASTPSYTTPLVPHNLSEPALASMNPHEVQLYDTNNPYFLPQASTLPMCGALSSSTAGSTVRECYYRQIAVAAALQSYAKPGASAYPQGSLPYPLHPTLPTLTAPSVLTESGWNIQPPSL